MKSLVWIGLAGTAGVLSRVGLVHSIQAYTSNPTTSILAVNTLGSFAAGGVAGVMLTRNLLHPDLYAALTIGFLGGFTTFSAFSMGTLELLTQGAYGRAALYLFGSPLIGLLAATTGWTLGRLV